jgi:hypothetical protein
MLPVDLFIIAFLGKCAHVNLYKIVMLEGTREVEARTAHRPTSVILNSTKLLREGVESVEFLNLEAHVIMLIGGELIGLEK